MTGLTLRKLRKAELSNSLPGDSGRQFHFGMNDLSADVCFIPSISLVSLSFIDVITNNLNIRLDAQLNTLTNDLDRDSIVISLVLILVVGQTMALDLSH